MRNFLSRSGTAVPDNAVCSSARHKGSKNSTKLMRREGPLDQLGSAGLSGCSVTHSSLSELCRSRYPRVQQSSARSSRQQDQRGLQAIEAATHLAAMLSKVGHGRRSAGIS
jgi:hypothetical protein